MSEQWQADQPGDDIWYVRDQEPIAVARCRDQEVAEQIVADHTAVAEREAREQEVRVLREALKDAQRLVVYHHDATSARRILPGVPCPICTGKTFEDAPALRRNIDAALRAASQEPGEERS